MCNGKCGGGCVVHKTSRILLFVGGLNWGLVGLGMLMSKDWNLVRMLLDSWSTLEAIVYLLVGVATVMTIFGCKCKKCMEACGGSCDAGSMDKKM